MTAAESLALRARLVERLREIGALHEERVADAFMRVPREAFLPGEPLDEVYRDRPFITHRVDGAPVSSSSQPAIMAIMLEMLDVRPGQRVLEIGAGTGYNAALLAALTSPVGRVVTVDIDLAIADEARAYLAAAGAEGVEVVAGDGGEGWRAGAPYDGIIATASCWQVPPAWVEQLREGGRLVLPLRLNGTQVVAAFERRGGDLESVAVQSGGFMWMRGSYAGGWEGSLRPDIHLSADVAPPPEGLAALAERWEAAREGAPQASDDGDSWHAALVYLSLQGAPLLDAARFSDGGRGFEAWRLLITSPDSAVRWRVVPPATQAEAIGDAEAERFAGAGLNRWQLEGAPGVEALRIRVTPAGPAHDLGPLPRPVAGRYRWARGAHTYEAWYGRPA